MTVERRAQMPIKYKVKSKEELPADYAGLYVQRDDAWVLEIEGAVDKARLDKVRHNNATLTKQFDELKY
jgi:hypothetical protein